MTPPVATTINPWKRRLFYFGPLIVWLAAMLVLAGPVGSYDATVVGIYTVFAFVAPHYNAPDIGSLYGITHVVRRSGYLITYSFFSLLVVRALQSGRSRLRRRSLAGLILSGILFSLFENVFRSQIPGRHGGWDDFVMSLGTLSVWVAVIYLYFQIKEWERAAFPGKRDTESRVADIPATEAASTEIVPVERPAQR